MPTNTTQGSSFLFLFHPLNLQNTTWIAYIHWPKNPTAHPFYLPSQSIKKKIWLMEKKTLEVYMVSILLLYTSMGRDKQQRGGVRSLDNVRCVKCQEPWPLPKLSERLITRSSQLHSVLKLAMFPFPFFFLFCLVCLLLWYLIFLLSKTAYIHVHKSKQRLQKNLFPHMPEQVRMGSVI